MSEFIQEKNRIKAILPPELYGFFKDAGVILAGGAITSLFTNNEINDFDIYFPDQRTLVDALAFAYGREHYCRYGAVDGGIETLRFHSMTDRSMLLEADNGNQNIQFIYFKYFANVKDIFDTFDFTCCMGAYDFRSEEFILHEDFMKHNSQRYLKFNPGTAFPLISALRVNKYIEKGYYISRPEMIKILFQCMQTEINSWEDVKSHIGGMYGYDMSDVFDEDKECTIGEVVEQLDTIDHRKIKKYVSMEGLDFNDIIARIDQEEDPDVMQGREGYFYKVVKEDMKSPLAANRLDYSLNKIVDGGRIGIYAYNSPTKVKYSYPIMVELKPLGEHTISGDGSTEIQIKGQCLVTRACRHDKDAILKKYEVKRKAEEIAEDPLEGILRDI